MRHRGCSRCHLSHCRTLSSSASPMRNWSSPSPSVDDVVAAPPGAVDQPGVADDDVAAAEAVEVVVAAGPGRQDAGVGWQCPLDVALGERIAEDVVGIRRSEDRVVLARKVRRCRRSCPPSSSLQPMVQPQRPLVWRAHANRKSVCVEVAGGEVGQREHVRCLAAPPAAAPRSITVSAPTWVIVAGRRRRSRAMPAKPVRSITSLPFSKSKIVSRPLPLAKTKRSAPRVTLVRSLIEGIGVAVELVVAGAADQDVVTAANVGGEEKLWASP